MNTVELGEPLPEGVFHLLTADGDVVCAFGVYVALCGEEMTSSDLPPSCIPEVEPGPNPLYCPACVRVAVRLDAEGDRECRGVGR